MANLNAFYQKVLQSVGIDATRRAIAAWTRINANAVSIVLVRNGVALAAQTVRLEYDDSARQDALSKPGGITSERELIIFGVQNHPSVSATDIKDGDLLKYAGAFFEVKSVLKLPGEIQARAVRRNG